MEGLEALTTPSSPPYPPHSPFSSTLSGYDCMISVASAVDVHWSVVGTAYVGRGGGADHHTLHAARGALGNDHPTVL